MQTETKDIPCSRTLGVEQGMSGRRNCRLVCILSTDWQSLRLTAANGHFPECKFSAAIRREYDFVSIRSPCQAFDETTVVGHLPRSAPRSGNDVDIADGALNRPDERDLTAIGGESGIHVSIPHVRRCREGVRLK